ncbi:glycoside hydrolase family 3 C-terminal domain-containing protein [Clostridium sp. Marseille-P2415]|uniref:glycoside hydrolase family 3 C-terminal domain-containing protein n=1 Tax=Clostridium sp. Marseille-P2415 TaxID=1805471 RepID=UPI00098887A9|nr:glycoside hydrolase family 3 C-terminal domain-containing protein [Clostridium sp. Marseille-P2415]
MNIEKIVKEMTLEEKAGLCSGADFWHTKAVERLGIPASMVSDGPHGLRKQDEKSDHLGVNESIKAVCFPTACATASSFDRELLTALGEALGDECQAEDISVILGPAVNIKRSPLCGRNFEYFSEDPYLASEMAASHINGVQSRQVGTSLKHFLANNQEHRRMTSDSVIDERTLREIYLAAFEGAVKHAKPWTVMCSYNKINGEYASENYHYLTEILRDEWGFDGYVMSDWGAVNNRVEGVKAGLDLEMPSSGGINDTYLIEAVKEGRLKEQVLDKAVTRILTIIERYKKNRRPETVWDKDAHHELARKMEGECAVLLKNEGILPLADSDEVAFIGYFAAHPRYQGGGSSHINSTKVESAVEAAKYRNVIYAQGYEINMDQVNDSMMKEAVEAAKRAKTAVIFAGLPDAFESEGYDRSHMAMPDCQNALIEAVAAVQPNTVVVLHNGSPVEMPWIGKVKGVLEAYLGGQAVGGAIVDILYGLVNPSGKLAETFPVKLEDNPSYLYYGGEKDVTEYREGVFVGYRYYDKKKMEVLFPFGYGLSYTTFEYSNMKADRQTMKDVDTVTVSLDVTNTGKVTGKEVVEIYVEAVNSAVIRPVRELREFAKVELRPGETKTVSFILGKRAFAYYHTGLKDWYAESGSYLIHAGASSRDLRETVCVKVEATVEVPVVYHLNSTVGDILADPDVAEIIQPLLDKYQKGNGIGNSDGEAAKSAISQQMDDAMFRYMPLRQMLSFAPDISTPEELQGLIRQMNEKKRAII